MPTEEELEQRTTDMLDRERQLATARAVIHELDAERLGEIFEKAVTLN